MHNLLAIDSTVALDTIASSQTRPVGSGGASQHPLLFVPTCLGI
jgi:hypothetical protein